MIAETVIRMDKCGSSGVGNLFPSCSSLIYQRMEQGRQNSPGVGTLVPCYYGSGPDPCGIEGGVIGLGSEEKNIGKNTEPRAAFPVAWCHGAVGIGMSRLCMLQYINDNNLHSEIKSAIKSTLDYGFGYNHSLCHGDFGHFDFLLCASQTSEYKYLENNVNQIAASILAGIDKYGFRFSNKFQVETCGLMIGLAGIGYECLRIADPIRVPSVLILSPPNLTNDNLLLQSS
ncbi:MAG: lanthionine synthetase LanC family protein [candidate division WOR-3 bacterium]